jgi:small-conductance mechanosensitive channel
MSKTDREVEQLREQEEVKTALRLATGDEETMSAPVPSGRERVWLGIYLLVLFLLPALYGLLGSSLLPVRVQYIPTLRHVLLGSFLIVLTAATSKGVRIFFIDRIENTPTRYNLIRVLNLAAFALIVIIALTVISSSWYTALVSLGVLSLSLGFALQTPITSLIGWVYLLIRQPYKVGDRIEIGHAKGDVIDVSYLDTTLWEFSGPYLSTQHPSGRIIKFPNSLVLNRTVYNYSWPLFPYMWNEIKLQVGYESDLDFITRIMVQVVDEELGQQMTERIAVYRELLRQTPLDKLDIQEHPVVHFRSGENGWLDAIVRYLVHPKESGRIKTRITKKLLDRLNSEPQRVLFPWPNPR